MNYNQQKNIKYNKLLNNNSDTNSDINSEELPISTIYDANNNFTITFFENLDSVSNMFSPLGISIILSLIHLGALYNTNNQLTNLLGIKYNIEDIKYLYHHFNNEVIKITNVFIANNKIKINKEYLHMI